VAGGEPAGRRTTARAALGTAVFVVFGGPALAAGLGPWLITRWRVRDPFLGWGAFRWIGVAFLVVGIAVAGSSWVRFVVQGRGTPSPTAPPVELVVTGLFRYVRNPMYLGILALVIGEGLVFGSWQTLAYAGALWLVFHLFVVLYEEPTLRRQFGHAYVAYCESVRRWIPRRRGTE
jgi:protein-S-isoprenylcysteine O-methyltransferase Ste14